MRKFSAVACYPLAACMFSGEVAKCGSIIDCLDLHTELRVGDLLSPANSHCMEKLLAYKVEMCPNRLTIR